MVTTDFLAKALTMMLDPVQLDTSMFTLHNLKRGGATAAYRMNIDQKDKTKNTMACGPVMPSGVT